VNRRERVLIALGGGQPDRVPFLDTIVEEPIPQMLLGKEHYEPHEIADLLGLDGFGAYIWPPVYAETTKTSEGLEYQGAGLLHTRADLARIDLPDPDDESLYESVRALVHRYSGEYVLWAGTMLGWHPTLWSMGLDGFAYALVDDCDLIYEILELYTEWQRRVIVNLQETGIDFLWLGDDIAFNAGPLFSPEVFRNIFLPYGRRVAEIIGVPWVFHSDGNLMPILEDLLSLGMAGLHPIQPNAMDIEALKRKYGERLCLWGNIDLEYTLTRGTPEEVKALVRRRIEIVGRGGGYILGSSNSITPYCKPENVLAMADAVRQYGWYNGS